jgi:hypothetical protein
MHLSNIALLFFSHVKSAIVKTSCLRLVIFNAPMVPMRHKNR